MCTIFNKAYNYFLLQTIPTLLVIDLTGNEVQQVQSYRSYAIHLFKSIEVLDHSLVVGT